MIVDDNLIKSLEQLSCLSFSPSEEAVIESDLSKMIAFVEKLNEHQLDVQLEDISISTNEIGLREDIINGTISVMDALKNAPVTKGQFFAVPKVINKKV